MKRETFSILYYIFFGAAVILLIYRMYLRSRNQSDDLAIVQWISVGCLLIALVCRFIPRWFPKRFPEKSTGEEIKK